MRFNLIPREEKFFDMFDEATAILTRASEKFLDMLTNFDRGPNPGRPCLPNPRRLRRICK